MSTPFPYLSALILLPGLAALSIAFLRNTRTAKSVAVGVAVVELLLAIALLKRFDFSSDEMQLMERHAWIPGMNIDYTVGVDGLSVFFPSCTALVTLAVLLSSWTRVHSLPRLYLILMLLLEGITVGIFCAMDLVLFFLFWELSLIPVYFLISLWGIGPNRRHAASQYALMMLFGGVPLLFGIILLAINHAQIHELPLPGGMTFDYLALLATPSPSDLQTTVFLLFLFGFGITMPLFPLHTWLPTVAMEGPAGVAALLTGLKLGAYGLLRFAIPLAPEAATGKAWIMATLGAVGLVYGALLALKQTNFRRLLAYASISHVGLVLIGLSALNLQGLQGALFQLISFSWVASGLFLLAGFLHHRLGSTELTHLGGLSGTLPLLTSFVFVLGLASLGVPGTSGFIAELLILIGAFESHVGLGLTALSGVVLGAGYFLVFFRSGFLGGRPRGTRLTAHDLRPRELTVIASLTGLTLLTGLVPHGILSATEPAARAWVKRAAGGFPEHPSAFARARPGKLPGHDAATPVSKPHSFERELTANELALAMRGKRQARSPNPSNFFGFSTFE